MFQPEHKEITRRQFIASLGVGVTACCAGGLARAASQSEGDLYEIVVLLVPSLNDSADEIKRMSEWIVKELGVNVPVHFSRYHPMYKLRNLAPTPVDTLRRARQAAVEQGINFVYIGNVPGEESQNTVCPSCKALLIRRYEYSILENNIAGGLCKKCSKPIPGVWD